jgi:GcrA cell cycle regulator
MQISKIWTEDRVEQLKVLWARGLSGSQIACVIGGTSRCAVIGKVHRLGLPPRAERCADPETIRLRREQKARRNAESQRQRRGSGSAVPSFVKRKPDEPVEPVEPFVGALNIPTADLRPLSAKNSNQCRHIQCAGPDYLACANPTLPGASWCGHHEQIVWTPPERRRAVKIDGNRRGVKASNFVGSYEFS